MNEFIDILLNISIYQLLTPLFSSLMIIKSLSRFKRANLTGRELTVVSTIWTGLALISLFPDFFIGIARLSGVKNGVYALIFFALIILFYTVFKLVISIETLEHKLTGIVRANAVDNIEKK